MRKIKLGKKAIILNGDCLQGLKQIPDKLTQTCVTSPPYFGLRDYGTGQWEGGSPSCTHDVTRWQGKKQTQGAQSGHASKADRLRRTQCSCGAIRVDSQIGLEETPEQYIQNLVEVFREVRRTLKDDGTLWINIGDSYAANRSYQVSSTKGGAKHGPGQSVSGKGSKIPSGMKQKDLIGIPWMLAFALRADGWYLRQDIIWHKPNVMPESVKDRCTKSHEYIFLLSKSARYLFDHAAIREAAVGKNHHDLTGGVYSAPGQTEHTGSRSNSDRQADGKRSKRSVWSVNTKPYKGAHFAVYPPALVEPCILAGSKSGDIVLDPFNGSGTTGQVALEHGRRYVGCELNPEYVELTLARLKPLAKATDQSLLEKNR